ncbi:hypothetical protein BaRGS_00028959 [Batillaria attramentaria]|uniref:Uncharacterized protein n=1 Tax=Batillaria attramentaria TaxID=370345 RepID=A0ABD0JXH9_9CAEN
MNYLGTVPFKDWPHFPYRPLPSEVTFLPSVLAEEIVDCLLGAASPMDLDTAKGHWAKLTAQHLGKRLTGKWQHFMLDLLCVDYGLKPALLLDFAVADVSAVHSLLKALQDSNLLQSRQLKILCIGMDVLVVNMNVFRDRLLSDTCEEIFSQYCFVDVSANLEKPEILSWDSDSLHPTRTCFLGLMDELQSEKETCSLSLDGDAVGHLPNPSTLFGVLLDYPVVYWYDMSVEAQENCLSMVPLTNFTLEAAVTDRREGADSKGGQYKRHVIYSFSVPEAFAGLMLNMVDDWYDVRKNLGLYFENATLVESQLHERHYDLLTAAKLEPSWSGPQLTKSSFCLCYVTKMFQFTACEQITGFALLKLKGLRGTAETCAEQTARSWKVQKCCLCSLFTINKFVHSSKGLHSSKELLSRLYQLLPCTNTCFT